MVGASRSAHDEHISTGHHRWGPGRTRGSTMTTCLIKYADAQQRARRSTETWHYPRSQRSTRRAGVGVLTRLRSRIRHAGPAAVPHPAFA
jgi:hypothetical protein